MSLLYLGNVIIVRHFKLMSLLADCLLLNVLVLTPFTMTSLKYIALSVIEIYIKFSVK